MAALPRSISPLTPDVVGANRLRPRGRSRGMGDALPRATNCTTDGAQPMARNYLADCCILAYISTRRRAWPRWRPGSSCKLTLPTDVKAADNAFSRAPPARGRLRENDVSSTQMTKG